LTQQSSLNLQPAESQTQLEHSRCCCALEKLSLVTMPRHPSQLYEAALEGLVLFAVLWIMVQRQCPQGVLLGTFLTLYGLSRCFIELFRVKSFVFSQMV
jgi:prolipoprotein diacylglyceryltransferase